MSIIKAVQDYLAEYDGMSLVSLADIQTDYTPGSNGTYALAPTGNTVLSRNVLGGRVYQNSYVFFAREHVPNETDRRDMYDFLENFTQWLESRADAGDLPVLPGEFIARELEAANHMLLEVEEDGLGIYQVQINLTITRR